MLFIIMFCIYLQEKDSIDLVRFTLEANNEEIQSINLYQYDGKCYVFLPSYADYNTMRIKYNASSLYINGKLFTSNSSFSDINTDEEYSIVIKNFLGIPVCESKIVFMKGENIPALSITLIDGTIDDINTSKEVSKSGYATMINSDKTVDYAGGLKEIHSRGNSSWFQAKKSYTLEFPQDINLLGMGEGKGWVLLSNSFDESGLRNKLAYETAKTIGVDYAVDSEYVDLYIDNVYYGLYLLTEKIDIGKNRVNINNLYEQTQVMNNAPLSSYSQFEIIDNKKIKRGFNIPNNPSDITGGYLLEIIHNEDRIAAKESLVQTSELSFSVVSPKYSSQLQVDYLYDYLNSVENAIKNKDCAGIDLNSFAKYYLIQELFANSDDCSVFFYKSNDSLDKRLHACSIWDFDLSLGNSWLMADINPKALYRNSDNWFNYLYDNEEFISILKQLYSHTLENHIGDKVIDELNKYRSRINQSYKMNIIRWRFVDTNRGWAAEAFKSQKHFDTLEEHIDYITDYLKQRMEFLNSVWIDNEEYITVSFSTFENTVFRKDYSVKKGTYFNENPIPEFNESKELRFLGWFDSEGNQFFPNKIITNNKKYTAKWESTEVSTSLSLKERIKSKITGRSKYLLADFGIVIMLIAVAVFVGNDIKRKLRFRRYKSGKDH